MRIFFFSSTSFDFRNSNRTRSKENEILIFKPRHDTISVISIEATVGRRTRDGWNINADISLLCGSLTTPPSDSGLSRLRFPSVERYCARPFPSRYILIAVNSQRARVSSTYPFFLPPPPRWITPTGDPPLPPILEGASWIPDAGSGYSLVSRGAPAFSSIFKNPPCIIRICTDVRYGNHVPSVNTAGGENRALVTGRE